MKKFIFIILAILLVSFSCALADYNYTSEYTSDSVSGSTSNTTSNTTSGSVSSSTSGSTSGSTSTSVSGSDSTSDDISQQENTATTMGENGTVITSENEVDVAPKALFVYPNANSAILSNEIRIELEVKNAQQVEFYLQRENTSGSDSDSYLGRGVLCADQTDINRHWCYIWDTNNSCNGLYQIYSEITNNYGKYISEAVGITVYNEIVQDLAQEEELIEEVTRAEEEVAIQEEAKQGEVQKSSDEIITTIETGAEEVIDIVQNSEETVITPEIEENIDNNVVTIEEDITEIAVKVEEGEILKQEIAEKETEKQNTEENIQTAQEDLDKFSEDTLPLLVTEKEEELYAYQEQHENIEQEINSCQEQLSGVEEEKRDLTNNILTTVDEIIKPIEEAYGGQTNQEIEAIKTETKNEIVQEIQRLESSVSEKTGIQIEKQEKLYMDSDNDGISDIEELRLKTDPFNPDTDGDGFLDGVEYIGGYDPLDPSPAEKIVYQDPRDVSPKKTDIYKVEQIKSKILPSGRTGLKIKGKGVPNSFVTVYIFSDPIVLVVKTDKNGNWEYTLDKPLSDGQHTIYATTTNNRGEIVAKSEPFVFAKNKDKVFRIFESVHLADISSPVYALEKKYTILIGAIVFLNIILALFLIGVLTVKRKKV